MVSIKEKFEELRDRHECALIPFITAGDPDLATTAKALQVLDQNGADIIELGIPYSDPLADGPTIQAAATRALNRGVTLESVIELVAEVTPKLSAPLVLFTYYNPILNRGIEKFLKDIYAAGARGLLVPDLPLEEMDFLLEAATAIGIAVILLVAPTSTDERINAIANRSQGFVYLVSVTGVTGIRQEVATRVEGLIASLHSATNKPVGVGFGVSEPAQAKQIKDWGADGVIVGSAIVKRLATDTPEAALATVGNFCTQLKAAIK
ncbi:tryptophan synthase subunit alpha [cf. Phormidesmis sp. LEGE 11477]|uniref:tryptophan synthase subunit alpha n=1 Tax=cf. Phormidesmis sp. LEGE 11477 TaxID=1828680 RepID=UPI001880F7B7|nr:tryptophan synthase subunit alpha [cf. Phormidesmis sp. LEGE 11477]MBE9061755.1 tryptophan synthase subunit alpha [cf. Phormidesmis sp. LEGE 11477]